MKLTENEKEAYKYISNMIINNLLTPGLHSKRWFATKFNLNNTQAHKILNIFVNRDLILPKKSKGYEINEKALNYVLMHHNRKGHYKYQLLKFEVRDNKCYVEKKIFWNNIFYAYLKSSFLINRPIKKEDLKNGILNYLSLEHLIWESSKKIKINLTSEFFEGISLMMNSQTFDQNLQIIEESLIEFNPDLFEETYTKNY